MNAFVFSSRNSSYAPMLLALYHLYHHVVSQCTLQGGSIYDLALKAHAIRSSEIAIEWIAGFYSDDKHGIYRHILNTHLLSIQTYLRDFDATTRQKVSSLTRLHLPTRADRRSLVRAAPKSCSKASQLAVRQGPAGATVSQIPALSAPAKHSKNIAKHSKT